MSNSGFTGITSLGGSLSNMSISKLHVKNVSANTISENIGNYTRVTVTGYAANGFATLANGAAVTVIDRAGAAATADNAIVLPQGALVENVTLRNNGTTLTSGGAPSLTVGGMPSPTSPTAPGTPWANAVTMAIINDGGAIANGVAVGSVGALAVSTYCIHSPVAADRYVSVSNAGDALTAGALEVQIVYLVQLPRPLVS